MAKALAPVTRGSSLDLFDGRPIDLPGFQLRTRMAVAVGRPKLEQWINAMQFAHAAADSAPYWWGDLLRYAESRADWQERMSQALDVTGLARQTLLNYTSICNRVEEPERRISPSIKHTDAVASLARPEQTKWLTQAAEEGWTDRELRENIRASKRRRVIEGQAQLEGMYRVLMVDCPWVYRDSGATVDGSLGKAARSFKGMSIEDLCKLPVEAHALPRAIMGFWVPAPLLYDRPGPREVIDAWGFMPKTGLVWDKVLGMPSHYGAHIVHEHFLICTRGACLPDVPTPQEKSIFVERREGDHSHKPTWARAWLMRHWTTGPYLELFGREQTEGWDVFGDDARLWADQVTA